MSHNRPRMFDSHAHLVADDQTRYPLNPMQRAADAPQLAEDPRFATNAQRVAARAQLAAAMAPVLVTRTTRDWIALLEA